VTSPATRQGADGTAYYVGATRSGSWAYPFRATTSARHGAPSVRTAPDTDQWTATFDDEFSGTALDQSKWSYRLGSAPTRTRSTNVARMVKITGGTMRLSVALDPAYPNASAATSHYLNAQVASEGTFQFTYGVASARIRFSPQVGQHGSFWLQSPTYASFPGDPARSGAEVDAVEYFGQGYRKGGLASFLYYRDRSRSDVKIGGLQPRAASLLPRGDTFANSYHVYTVRWTPSGYTFYIDGRVLYTSTQAVSRTGEYLILSLLTSDWELAHLDRGSLPTTMSVDWAKVWQDG
jgi:beta-glucanase (GH16 family)